MPHLIIFPQIIVKRSQRIARQVGFAHELSEVLRLAQANGADHVVRTDRPDLRYGLEILDATALFRDSDFAIARTAIDVHPKERKANAIASCDPSESPSGRAWG